MYKFIESEWDYNNDSCFERIIHTQDIPDLSKALSAIQQWLSLHPDAWVEESVDTIILELCEDIDNENLQQSARIEWAREE